MKQTFLAFAAIILIAAPLSVSAYGKHHRGPQKSHNPPVVSPVVPPVVAPPSVPTPPTIPTPPVVSVNFTLGAFNASVGTVDVEFVDVTDLYVPSSNGKTLFVYLENNSVSNTVVASGKYDTQLKAWAAKLPQGTIISIGHEFDLTENPWGGNPTTFLAMYKHIHDLLGTSFKYAFVANNSDTPGTPGIGAYWPGANYVDIVSEDGFDWGGESLSQALQPNFALLKAYATGNGKPLWVTSTGTASNQASWITVGLSWAKANGVSGLLYFSYDSGGNFALTTSGLNALK